MPTPPLPRLAARAYAATQEARGPDSFDTASARFNLASAAAELGRYDEARAHFEGVLSIFEPMFGPDHAHTRKVRDALDKLDVVEAGEPTQGS